MAFESRAMMKYRCPKCNQFTLSLNVSDKLYVCSTCEDTWSEEDVVRFNRVHLEAIVLPKCEVCGKNDAEVEFRIPFPIPPVDQNGTPVGYKMINADICLRCYGSTASDSELAGRIVARRAAGEAGKNGEQ